MLKDRVEKIADDEYQFFLVCENTNVSANGEIFLNLKVQENTLTFRTDYFANSFDYIALSKDIENSDENKNIFTVSFGEDIFELEVLF